MYQTRSEYIVHRLQDLRVSSPEVEGSALVSLDGLTIGSDLSGGVEEELIAAMSAAMLSLGERIAEELDRGDPAELLIRGTRGNVILIAAGNEAVLTVLARHKAKLGLLLLDMRRIARDLGRILGQMVGRSNDGYVKQRQNSPQ